MIVPVSLFLLVIFHNVSTSAADLFDDDHDDLDDCWWKLLLLSFGCAASVALIIYCICFFLPCCLLAKRRRRNKEMQAQMLATQTAAAGATNPVYYIETETPQYPHMYHAQQPRGWEVETLDTDSEFSTPPSYVHDQTGVVCRTVVPSPYHPTVPSPYHHTVIVSTQQAYPQQVTVCPPPYNPHYPPPPAYSTISTSFTSQRNTSSRDDPYLPAYNGKY